MGGRRWRYKLYTQRIKNNLESIFINLHWEKVSLSLLQSSTPKPCIYTHTAPPPPRTITDVLSSHLRRRHLALYIMPHARSVRLCLSKPRQEGRGGGIFKWNWNAHPHPHTHNNNDNTQNNFSLRYQVYSVIQRLAMPHDEIILGTRARTKEQNELARYVHLFVSAHLHASRVYIYTYIFFALSLWKHRALSSLAMNNTLPLWHSSRRSAQ